MSDACAPKRVRPLLTVAQLRDLLERVERNGGGDWDIDVFPDSLVARNTEQDDIDFELIRYGVTGVDTLGGDGTEAFVLLRFAPAPLGSLMKRGPLDRRRPIGPIDAAPHGDLS